MIAITQEEYRSLESFQRESNRIEGIKVVRKIEVEALAQFVQCERPWIDALEAYVKVIQPDAVLRATEAVPGVRVGNHVAPPSGPKLIADLCMLLDGVVFHKCYSPYKAHCIYETLHPFTDGNGRSGRALWLWMRNGVAPLGFLHHFYYETLSECGR